MAYPLIDARLGSWACWNGLLVWLDSPQAEFLFQPVEGPIAYEVVRLVDGLPLFWSDHWQRLAATCVSSGLPIPADLRPDVDALIRKTESDGTDLRDANLRLVVGVGHTVVHVFPSYYPDLHMLRQGVTTGILQWERANPQVKLVHEDYKRAVAAALAGDDAGGPYFEVLLADRGGLLTEGSRSNFFLIEHGRVLSAPESRILIGITRKYVLRAIEAAGVESEIAMLTLADIERRGIRSAYLSGSPIDLAPIRSIEAYRLDTPEDPVFERILKAYQRIAAADLAEQRSLRAARQGGTR